MRVPAQFQRVPLIKTTACEGPEVFPEQPFDCVEAVVEERLQLLPSKARLPGAGRGQSKNTACLEVVIPAEDVWLTVMVAMFPHPQMPRRSEQHRAYSRGQKI